MTPGKEKHNSTYNTANVVTKENIKKKEIYSSSEESVKADEPSKFSNTRKSVTLVDLNEGEVNLNKSGSAKKSVKFQDIPNSEGNNSVTIKAKRKINQEHGTTNGDSSIDNDVNVSSDQLLEHQSNPSKIKPNFSAEDLTSDDEILTFQCPQNFSVDSLLKKRIDLNGQTLITDNDGKEFNCQVFGNAKNYLSCIFPSKDEAGNISGKCIKMPVVGHIVIRENMNTPKICFKSKKEKKPTVALPNNYNTNRHPLLGTNWKEHLKSAKEQIKKNKVRLKKQLKLKKKLKKERLKRKKEMSNIWAVVKKKRKKSL